MQTQSEFAKFLHQQIDTVIETEPVLAAKESGLTRVHFSELLKNISKDANERVKEQLADEFDWHGPLKNLFFDTTITEIIVNAYDCIYFEQNGQLFQSEKSFLSERTFHYFVDQLIFVSKINIDKVSPQACGTWSGFRVHVSRPEATGKNYQICFRRLNLQTSNSTACDTLLSKCSAIDEALRQAVSRKENILILGTTGSGKTTLANRVLKLYPAQHRFLILEDTSELQVPNAASSKLITRSMSQDQLPAITLTDLIHQSLRMRPDSIVIGEIRSSEAKDYLLSLSTGHSGSVATMHADSAQQALFRLEMLVQMGAPQWSLDTIRRLISLSLQKLVMIQKNKNGERVVTGVYRIASLESDGFRVDPVAELESSVFKLNHRS